MLTWPIIFARSISCARKANVPQKNSQAPFAMRLSTRRMWPVCMANR